MSVHPRLYELMNEYGQSHQNRTNQLIHKIFVPLIVYSTLGLLYLVKISYFETNLALIIVVAALFYYFQLSRFYCLIMAIFSALCLTIAHLLERQGILLSSSLFIFGFSWLMQFYGHKVEGVKPSFFKDLFFLLIGPLWVVQSCLPGKRQK